MEATMTSIRLNLESCRACGVWIAPRYQAWAAHLTLAAAFVLILAVVMH